MIGILVIIFPVSFFKTMLFNINLYPCPAEILIGNVLFADIEQRQTNRSKRQIQEHVDECSPERIKQKCVVFHNSCYFIGLSSLRRKTYGDR